MPISNSTYTNAALRIAQYIDANSGGTYPSGSINQDTMAAIAQGIIEMIILDAVITVTGAVAGAATVSGYVENGEV